MAIRLSDLQLSPGIMDVSLKTQSGRVLKTRYAGDLLIVEQVSREPIRITIKRSGMFSKKYAAVLFPIYRGAKQDFVIYTLLNVKL